MANEIDIIFKSVFPPVADPTVKRTVVFDVKHNGEDKIIAVDQEVTDRAANDVLFEKSKNLARILYAEYESQTYWLGQSLPITKTIDLNP